MGTDRELLEAAARAAGMTIGPDIGELVWWADSDTFQIRCANGTSRWWNPLHDSGQALALAVKLGLTICNEHESAGVVYCTRGDTEEFPVVWSGKVGDPPGVTDADYAATRLAIVRAAAAIAASGEVERG